MKFGLVICNEVKNSDNCAKETKFCINSYGKLSTIHKDGKYQQIANPVKVNNFWQWLFENQDRVGDERKVETPQKSENRVPDISHLLFFIGLVIVMSGKRFLVESIKAVRGGVKMRFKDLRTFQIMPIQYEKKDVIDVKICEKTLKLGRQKEIEDKESA